MNLEDRVRKLRIRLESEKANREQTDRLLRDLRERIEELTGLLRMVASECGIELEDVR